MSTYALQRFAQLVRNEALAEPAPEPVTAQHRFRHPQKTMPDWLPWRECPISNRVASYVDSLGYEIEYRNLYAAPVPEPSLPPPAKPAVETVKFLANGTRFKMSFFHNEDSEGQVAEGMYVTCFEGFEDELDGRWVALVAAEDDCHMKLNASPPPPAEVPMLSDEEIEAAMHRVLPSMSYPLEVVFMDGVRVGEQLVRRKAGL